MAEKFKPYKILSTKLNSLPIKNGQLIITTDTKKLYLDSENKRILLNEDNVNITNTNPTSGTWYYPTWSSGNNGYQSLRANDGMSYYTLEGTTSSSSGRALLSLGNNKSIGTAGNKRGLLRIYGEKNGYVDLYAPDNTTGTRRIDFPDAAGTVALTSSTVDKAIKDKNGLQIDIGYLKLSGGTMTGDVVLKNRLVINDGVHNRVVLTALDDEDGNGNYR